MSILLAAAGGQAYLYDLEVRLDTLMPFVAFILCLCPKPFSKPVLIDHLLLTCFGGISQPCLKQLLSSQLMPVNSCFFSTA